MRRLHNETTLAIETPQVSEKQHIVLRGPDGSESWEEALTRVFGEQGEVWLPDRGQWWSDHAPIRVACREFIATATPGLILTLTLYPEPKT